ncbi:MAG: exodeoxyribonuclease III [Candidatus Moraniibacteriota bacterium]
MQESFTLISWNVNGLRAAGKKGFVDWMQKGQYPIVCVQETKVSHPDQLPEELRHPDGYTSYFHSATEKKGYSGVGIYTKRRPFEVKTFFGDNLLSREGRVIEMEFREFTLVNVYFPNGGSGDIRLQYKLQFYEEFLHYLKHMKKQGKKIVLCGDVNTAHREIDLARPKENANTSGFMQIEREWIDKLEAAGFIDTFRAANPETVQYSWWDMKTRARERNVGWRIDYFFVDESLKNNIKDTFILDDVAGSDHAPVGLTLAFTDSLT